MDPSSLSYYLQGSVRVLQVSGAVPFNPRPGWRRVLARAYSINFLAVNLYLLAIGIVTAINTDLSNYRIILRSACYTFLTITYVIKMFLFVINGASLNQLVKSTPLVVISRISSRLKKYQKKAMRKCIFVFIMAFFLLIAVPIVVIVFPGCTADDSSCSNEMSAFENIIPSLVSNYYLKLILRAYQPLVIFTIITFSGGYAMLHIHILTLVEGYLDHLDGCVRVAMIRSKKNVRLGKWLSEKDCNNIDLRYCVSLHQFIDSLVQQINSVFAMQLLVKVVRTGILTIIVAGLYITVDQSMGDALRQGVANTFFLIEIFTVFLISDNIKCKSLKVSRTAENRIDPVKLAQNKVKGDYHSLLVISERSKIPFEIKGGLNTHFTRQSFYAIFSYCLNVYLFIRGLKF